LDFGSSPLAEEALFGAFLAACELPPDRCDAASDSLAGCCRRVSPGHGSSP